MNNTRIWNASNTGRSGCFGSVMRCDLDALIKTRRWTFVRCQVRPCQSR